MKKLIALLTVSFLLYQQPAWPAALTFGAATSDRVDHGSAASLDNLNPLTIIIWHYPTTWTDGRNLYGKRASTNVQDVAISIIVDPTNKIEVRYQGSTGTWIYSTNTTTFTTNKWWYSAFTFNSANAAGSRWKIYTGDLTTIAAQESVSVTTEGSGTHDDSGGNAVFGNINVGGSFTRAIQGNIAFVGIWNREMTIGEIRQQQFHPHSNSGCVVFNFCGFNGTSTQYDWSGNNNNGTVTGATLASAGGPLGLPFEV